ncbi:MAG: transcriptional regulator [Polyangiaceae bacterium]
MSLPKSYRSFAEFEREVLYTERRIGLSLEEMVEDHAFDAEVEVDEDDPFSEMADDDY